MGARGGINRTIESISAAIKKENSNHLSVRLVILQPCLQPTQIQCKDQTETRYRLRYIKPKLPSDVEGSLGRYITLSNETIGDIAKIVSKEKPDILLLFGTYVYTWLLFEVGATLGLSMLHFYSGSNVIESPGVALLENMERSMLGHQMPRVFATKFTMDRIQSTLGTAIADDVYFVPNGVPAQFLSLRDNQTNRKQSVGWVGRHHPIKNPSYMLRVSDEFQTHDIAASIQMVVSNRDRMGKNSFGPYISRGIEVLPRMSDRQLAEFYRSQQCIINTSFFETFGNVPLEAVACGTPAFVPNTIGVKEVFGDLGLDRYIFDLADTEYLCTQIRELTDAGYHPRELRRARELIKTTYTWDVISHRYLRLLTKLV